MFFTDWKTREIKLMHITKNAMFSHFSGEFHYDVNVMCQSIGYVVLILIYAWDKVC